MDNPYQQLGGREVVLALVERQKRANQLPP